MYSYFAAEMPDPYDATKSWSIEVEEEEGSCEGGQCAAAGGGAPPPPPQHPDALSEAASGAEQDLVNPLYMYDSCSFTEDGGFLINGADKLPACLHTVICPN